MRRTPILLLLTLALLVLSAGPALGARGDRVLVPSSRITQRPFRSIVLITVGRTVACTGTVIAPRKVLTAAHCLARDAAARDYRFRTGLPGNIRLFRGYSAAAGGIRYPSCGVSKVWAHSRFIRRDAADRLFGSRAHDYAVLTTSRGCSYPLNAVMRMWATTHAGGELRSGQVVKMAGYPADPRFERMNGLNLWRTKGKVEPSSDDPRMIRMTGFVAQGMSGGPLWRTFGPGSPCARSECLVGVVTECAVNGNGLCRLGDSTRRAVRITPAVKRIIRNR